MRWSNANKIFITVLIAVSIFGCKKDSSKYKAQASNPDFIHQSVKKLTDVMVHDIFSPPVASRIYAYPSIAAYEVLINDHPEYRSLAGQLNGLKDVPKPDKDKEYCFPLASISAYLAVGKALVFSEDKMDSFKEKINQRFDEMGIPDDVFERSVAYGNTVSEHILNWADKDNYKETRTFPKFTVTDNPTRWQPTPPAYMEAIEPHWNKIRPFVIDSATQFVPAQPTPFNMEKGSEFYNEVVEVYETGKNLTDEQADIASFWDCNPYVSHVQGHVMFATKKITPGGHWIGITAIATKTKDYDLMETLEAYTMTSITLADAFISCWDEKYRSNLIRPETLINQHIDEDWAPLLQTPPFPEYTSGHSVASAAAATTLTHLMGEPFDFVDTTEVEYGLPPRTFKSFMDAANEAAISRLYGGIHYMPAIKNGVEQGKKVGNFVIDNIDTRKSSVSANN